MRRVLSRVLAGVLWTTLMVQWLSCEALDSVASQVEAELPAVEVTLADTTLVSAPSLTQIAAWYCPQTDPTGLLCATLGPPPQTHEMQFHFELVYQVDNPNEFPIPTTELLTAIQVFEGGQQATLGAICTVLCAEGDVTCTGAPGANSCQSDEADIETLDDLEGRLEGLLHLTVDAAINGELDNLAVRSIPAGSENFEVRIRFSLGVDAMIDLLSTLSDELVSDIIAGQPVQIEIPYSVHGTLWFEAPVLGRIAVHYGPFEDVWLLEL